MVTSVVYVRVGARAVRVRNCAYERVCPFVSMRAYLSVQCARVRVRVCAYMYIFVCLGMGMDVKSPAPYLGEL